MILAEENKVRALVFTIVVEKHTITVLTEMHK